MGVLQERIASTKTGSITSVQAVYVPADDLTDPSPATTFAHLDANVVLSRQIASLGIYPAVDPLDSNSRQLEPAIVGQEHYDVTNAPGKYVPLSETIRGFKGIVNGDYDDIPEQAFYMTGNIDEVVEKAKTEAA